MSHAIEPTPLRRLRFTPMRDLVRGRITGRLDLRTRVETSNLPPEAKELIGRVVRRTRLWSLEKVTVADDLIAHFADGIESGQTIDALVEAFGDERIAAALIRRAKWRNRPMILHVLNALRWLLVMAAIIYLISAAHFLIGRPSIKVNYVDELNRAAEQVPLDQRAWPIYRQAILSIDYQRYRRNEEWDILDATPGSKQWPQLVAWTKQHANAIDLAREGTRKPALGFILGPNGSWNDKELWPDETAALSAKAGDDLLLNVWAGYLPPAHLIYRMLIADANVARDGKEGERLVQDIDALLSLSEQWCHVDFISGVRSISARRSAYDEIERTLTTAPLLFKEPDLQQLAHRIGKPNVAADWISFQSERMVVYDLVQRMYTDNGAGDGRLTRQGLALMSRLVKAPSRGAYDRQILQFAGAATPMLASRRAVLKKYDRLIDAAEANLRVPMRDANWQEINREIIEMNQSPVAYIEYAPLPIVIPSLNYVQYNAEFALGIRDALLVSIALELYHRRHGEYPPSLNQLTPLLLPAIPADRITGEPLHYRLIDGKPLIYSVGADRDDDSGREPVYHRTRSPYYSARWDVDAKNAMDGDWVLYPQPKSEPLDENE